jgi:predicted exporter
VKQGQRNFVGIVSTQEHLSLWPTISCCLWTTHRGLLMVMFVPLDALRYLASDILISIVFDLAILSVFILILLTTLWMHKHE